MSTLPKEIFARKGLPPLPHAGLASVSEDPSVPDQPLPHKNLRQRCLREYSPLDWNEFFDKKVDVMVGQDKFCVYLKGTSGPLFYMLHGGGYSGLTWSCLAEELSKLLECRILAPDLRGHGNTETKDETDFSSETQVADIVAIHDALFKDECIPTILVGHSMGGALAIHAAVSGNMVNVVGLVVVDVVEGTALEALSSMTRLLADRPRQFPSIESECCTTSFSNLKEK
ncbi:hypothetical protein AB6A40_010309 [Gnathostoma spinigerum]|uniref:protein phosphatase methylesterase-1 n=1 Tax=Gnathostoma spinigerum TaxID=75299 RepID=A0ABD6EUE6_9BILA